MPRTAYFAALYMLWPGIEISPKSDEMLTRWPSPEAIRCGRNSLVPCTTPQKLMPDDPVHVGVLEVLEVAGERDAGVVDDDVDPAELLGDRVGVRRERGAVGDVEMVAADLAARRRSWPGRPSRRARRRRRRRSRAARPPGEVERERPADAGAGPGDDDDLVVERLHATCSFRGRDRRRRRGRTRELAAERERRLAARGRCCGRACRGTSSSSRRSSRRSASSGAAGWRSTSGTRPGWARPRRSPDRRMVRTASRR